MAIKIMSAPDRFTKALKPIVDVERRLNVLWGNLLNRLNKGSLTIEQAQARAQKFFDDVNRVAMEAEQE